MAKQWYFTKNNQQQGPVTLEHMRQLVAAGHVGATDMVWEEGMPSWVQAGQAQALALPAVGPPPVGAGLAGPPVVPMAVAAGEPLTQAQKVRRIMLIVAAGVVILCFFIPLFYNSAEIKAETPKGAPFGIDLGAAAKAASKESSASSLCFGWNVWWGVVTFILGFLALAGPILDLVLQRVRVMRLITRWTHLGLFGVIALLSLLGTLLGLFGIGMAVEKGGVRMSLNDFKDMFKAFSMFGGAGPSVSTLSIPIGAIVLLAAGVFGLIVAINVARGDKK